MSRATQLFWTLEPCFVHDQTYSFNHDKPATVEQTQQVHTQIYMDDFFSHVSLGLTNGSKKKKKRKKEKKVDEGKKSAPLTAVNHTENQRREKSDLFFVCIWYIVVTRLLLRCPWSWSGPVSLTGRFGGGSKRVINFPWIFRQCGV